MIKILILAFAIMFTAGKTYSQSFTGDYNLGDDKISITLDDNSYYVVHETGGIKGKLQYEENTPENDQIWLEWQNGKQVGTYVFKSDYSKGIYTDYKSGQESYIKKRD
ncbi:MAG: hypothetical protein ABI543_07210 [Ignavibacteria bacterium]